MTAATFSPVTRNYERVRHTSRTLALVYEAITSLTIYMHCLSFITAGTEYRQDFKWRGLLPLCINIWQETRTDRRAVRNTHTQAETD